MQFRTWVIDCWYQHCDEVESWTGSRPGYLSREYFLKYRWWLRREFRHVCQTAT